MESVLINIKMHRLLHRQVSKFLSDSNIETLTDFITAVNDAYNGFEEGHRQLERTLEISSNELFKANSELKETKLNLEATIKTRTEELIRINNQLMESELRFRSLVEASYDMITILEPNGTIKYESPSAFRILGFDESYLIGLNCMELVHPEDAAEVAARIQLILENPGVAHSIEFRFKKADGEYMWMESVGKLVDDGAYVSGIIVNSRDVTERHYAQRQMSVQSRILDSMASNMPIAIYGLDENGCFVSSKGKAFNPLVNAEEELIGKSIFEFIPDKKDEIQSALEGNVVHFTWSRMVNGDERHFENFIFQDGSSAHSVLVGFAIDVTLDKQREYKLQDSFNSLERINKELDQYAYVVSHDLKAPLRAISNLSIWIEEEIGDALVDDAKTHFNLLRGRISRMEMLINGILEYSRAGRSTNPPEAFNTNAMASEIIAILSPPAQFKFEVDPNLPTVKADRLKIEQVFSNFISNAIKYNSSPNPVVKVGYNSTPTHHVFFVNDNGPGIEPEFHEKVFVIFQTLQARDKVESTGVGLAIVKKIIEEAGGTAWLESEPGKGSTFFFSLPK